MGIPYALTTSSSSADQHSTAPHHPSLGAMCSHELLTLREAQILRSDWPAIRPLSCRHPAPPAAAPVTTTTDCEICERLISSIEDCCSSAHSLRTREAHPIPRPFAMRYDCFIGACPAPPASASPRSLAHRAVGLAEFANPRTIRTVLKMRAITPLQALDHFNFLS